MADQPANPPATQPAGQRPNVGKDLLQVPFPEMIKAMATGIVEAQFALDMMSLKIAKMMAGGEPKDLVKFDKQSYSLLELGFMPTFYQFVDTIIEVKMSISMSTEESTTRGTFDMDSEAGFEAGVGFLSAHAKASLNVSTVSASFASKYQYSAEGSSLMRTKLVPVPPPALLEKRIRDMVDRDAPNRKPKQ
jgi:hypothetical protein